LQHGKQEALDEAVSPAIQDQHKDEDEFQREGDNEDGKAQHSAFV
jgi:hypothetical protein